MNYVSEISYTIRDIEREAMIGPFTEFQEALSEAMPDGWTVYFEHISDKAGMWVTARDSGERIRRVTLSYMSIMEAIKLHSQDRFVSQLVEKLLAPEFACFDGNGSPV